MVLVKKQSMTHLVVGQLRKMVDVLHRLSILLPVDGLVDVLTHRPQLG